MRIKGMREDMEVVADGVRSKGRDTVCVCACVCVCVCACVRVCVCVCVRV